MVNAGIESLTGACAGSAGSPSDHPWHRTGVMRRLKRAAHFDAG
jgi:hypothetical protein